MPYNFPQIKVDNSINFAWVSPTRKHIFVLSGAEILKISLDKSQSVSVLLTLESPAISAIYNNEDDSLVLLARTKISVIDTNRWIIRKELDLSEEQVHLLQDVREDLLWITTIPSVWEPRVRTKSKFQYVVGTPGLILVIDLSSGKVVSSQERDVTRGQYLSQFLSSVTDSLSLTPLSSLVSLVSSSLSCSFIRSSIRDIVIHKTKLLILTADGDLWQVSRKTSGAMKTLELTEVVTVCQVGHEVTLLTRDGAVYCLDLNTNKDSVIGKSVGLKTTGNMSDVLQRQVQTLSRVGAAASEVQGRLEQIKLYQQLSQRSLETLGEIFRFQPEFNASLNLLQVTFGVKEKSLHLSGEHWFLKIDVTGGATEQRTSLRVTFPELVTSATENISASLNLSKMRMRTGALQVSGYLVFNPECPGTAGGGRCHLPAVKVAETSIEVENSTSGQGEKGLMNTSIEEDEENFLLSLGLSKEVCPPAC